MNLTKLCNLQHANLRRSVFTRIFCTLPEEKIEIPKRIQRGPTDILRALESTIGRDPTAAHYKYHDDPFLIPRSNIGKRSFAMAQEAGKKAAHWVRKQHTDLFNHREAEPPIEAFFPPMIYDENSDVTIKDLMKVIETSQVSDARLLYKLLKDKNVEIPMEVKQSLLEMLCYQNCEDAVSDEFIEERWFKQSNNAKEKIRKTWKDGDFAEEVFIEMEPATAEAYTAIIQGMVKYHQVSRAWQLFEEAQQKNYILNTNTFNSLISVVNYIKEDFDMRWALIINLLTQMKQSNLKPNLGTLNAVLHSLSSMGNTNVAKKNSLMVLAEFKKLGIEPSLASWYYILTTFCKERGTLSNILEEILNLIENKEHKIRDIRDVNFFLAAMDGARHHWRDVNLANRVNTLLHFGDNYNLIGDSYKESIYFRHYLALLCSNMPLDEFMNDIYNKLVPHIYVPEPGIMAEILKQVDIHASLEYIPQLWSDIVVFDHAYRENLIDLITNTMINNKQLLTPELNERFSHIAWDIYRKIEEQHENKTTKMIFTGELLGRILIMLLRNNEFEKACTVMEKLDKSQDTVVGVPNIEALSLFVDHCISEKAPSRAINCIQYCVDCGFPDASDLAIKVHKKLNLDEQFLNKLSKIVNLEIK